MRPTAPPKLIIISPMGNLGNRMIQFMVAKALAARVQNAVLAQIPLEEWGLGRPPWPHPLPRTAIVTEPTVDLAGLAAALNDDRLDCVDIRTYGQRIENFLPPDAYRPLFAGVDASTEGAGPNQLLCNVRQGDILNAHHEDYVLIPLDFYAELIETTGLQPVFMGQLEESPYLAALKTRFPHARFIPSRGAIADFHFIRNSRNIVLSVSTFSWLAAWLSHADTIVMPVLGVLHPLQSRATNLLPINDPRFSFYLFPFHYAVPVQDFASAHASLKNLWRKMPPPRLQSILASATPFQPRPPASEAALLLESVYLRRNPDVAAAVAAGYFPSGRLHFAAFGQREGRPPCAIDNAWYCQTYPAAAFELGQGDAADPLQHWLDLGQYRDYRRAAAE
jgi:hypothetical protein